MFVSWQGQRGNNHLLTSTNFKTKDYFYFSDILFLLFISKAEKTISNFSFELIVLETNFFKTYHRCVRT